jgi:hypothetical protein
MFVYVTSEPCGPESRNCAEALRIFAARPPSIRYADSSPFLTIINRSAKKSSGGFYSARGDLRATPVLSIVDWLNNQ